MNTVSKMSLPGPRTRRPAGGNPELSDCLCEFRDTGRGVHSPRGFQWRAGHVVRSMEGWGSGKGSPARPTMKSDGLLIVIQ